MKPIPKGVTFIQTLTFGDWPIDKIEEIISELHTEWDLSKHELDYINRGGYQKCQGYDSHKACDEILETMGKIVYKRVKA